MIPTERRDSPRSQASIMRGCVLPRVTSPPGCIALHVVDVHADCTDRNHRLLESGTGRVDASHCGVFGSPGAVVVYSPPHAVQDSGFLGFGRASRAFPSARATVLSVPFWALVVVTLALPLSALRRRARDRRLRREGRCPNCGYDLRASPGRCPECGQLADAAATAQVR